MSIVWRFVPFSLEDDVCNISNAKRSRRDRVRNSNFVHVRVSISLDAYPKTKRNVTECIVCELIGLLHKFYYIMIFCHFFYSFI